jgi:carboxymethylenebutenolidase
MQAASHHGLAGVIGFYGSPLARPGFTDKGPIDRVTQMECPVLGLFGGADQGIPVDAVRQFDLALTSAGIEHSLHVYPEAPHSFFDRKYDEYQAESIDAWNRMLDFIGRHTR